MVLIVDQGLDDLDYIDFFTLAEFLQPFSQLEFVAVDGFLDEFLPFAVVGPFDIELLFDFRVAILNIFFVRIDLSQDDVDIRFDGVEKLLVGMALDELVEIGVYFEEVDLFASKVVELFHVDISLFTHDEQSDPVVGIDVEEVIDVGSHKLEDEHDVVTTIQVKLGISLNCQIDVLLLFIFLNHVCCVIDSDRHLSFFFEEVERLLIESFLLLRIHQILIDLHIFLIEVLILLEADL